MKTKYIIMCIISAFIFGLLINLEIKNNNREQIKYYEGKKEMLDTIMCMFDYQIKHNDSVSTLVPFGKDSVVYHFDAK